MPRDKDLKRVVRKRMAASGERYTEARAAIRPSDRPTVEVNQAEEMVSPAGLVEVEIPHDGIRVHVGTGQHFVVLKQRDRDRSLTIWIGITEANAIAVALTGWTVQRPLTSDLIVSTIRALGGDVERVVIPRFDNGTFYAEVHVRRDGAALAPMDARPSDALGVAVRTGARIFVADDVMDARSPGREVLPDAVDVLSVRARTSRGTEVRGAAYSPIASPTHIVVDAVSARAIALLRVPSEASEQPSTGTLLSLQTATGVQAYRVDSVELGSDGLVRLGVVVEGPSSEPTLALPEVG